MAAESDTSTPWMDRAWMESVLRDVENDPSLTITDYQLSHLSSLGNYYLSEIHVITFQLQRAGEQASETSLIVKKLPPGEELHRKLSQSSAFPTEIKVFTVILPKFQALLEQVAPGRFEPFAARHVYSQNHFPYFLCVSNLAAEGFRMATRQRGLDLDHCLLVMKALGRFHAVSVSIHDTHPRLIESFKENMFSEDPPSDISQSFLKPSINSVAKVARSWSCGGDKMANKLLRLADTFYQQLKQQILSRGERLNVLIHGDLWTNNLLFKYDDVTGDVEDVRLMDFQLACYTSCAIDLQYFMHTSPRDDVRVTHTEDILREYHSELCSTLELLGLAEKVITFQELLDEYESKAVYGFITSLFVLPLVMADSENAADVEALLGRDGKTESDNKRCASKEFVKVIKRLLPEFERRGFF